MASTAASAVASACDRVMVALESVRVIEVSLVSANSADKLACTFAAVSAMVKETEALAGAADCRAAACATVAPVTTRL